jgi:hypothetical protein
VGSIGGTYQNKVPGIELRKQFFFEKKNQKTFICYGTLECTAHMIRVASVVRNWPGNQSSRRTLRMARKPARGRFELPRFICPSRSSTLI